MKCFFPFEYIFVIYYTYFIQKSSVAYIGYYPVGNEGSFPWI